MARKHTPEEIVRKLREGEQLIGAGKSTYHATCQEWPAGE
jgi:hypothetical protein